MACSAVWNQSCLSLSSLVLTSPPAHKRSQSSGEPWDSVSVEFHISSISSPLVPSASPPGQLGRKRHMLNTARLLLLRELEQGEAAPRPYCACCISPLVSSACSSWISRILRCHWEQACATSPSDSCTVKIVGETVCLSFIIWSLHVRETD